MYQCVGCNQDLPEEFCCTPRLPCPFCGAKGRISDCMANDTATASDEAPWLHTRQGQDSDASISSDGQMEINLFGRSPRNEEGALAASARLVRKLNADGADWSEPVPGEQDVDAESRSVSNPDKKLLMQVVRAADEDMWRTLGRQGSAKQILTPQIAADLLIGTIRKKARRYPLAQRRDLTLVLDATQTPNYTFSDVHEIFAQAHRAECLVTGFTSVWIVGSMDALVVRIG